MRKKRDKSKYKQSKTKTETEKEPKTDTKTKNRNRNPKPNPKTNNPTWLLFFDEVGASFESTDSQEACAEPKEDVNHIGTDGRGGPVFHKQLRRE
jgi:hypothetical protein